MSRKKILLVGFLIIVGLAALGLLLRHPSQKVSVSLGQQVSIKIYKKTGHEPYDYNRKSLPVASLNQNSVLNLKKGDYVVVVDNPANYSSGYYSLTAAQDLVTLSINPSYSKEKLGRLFETEGLSIHQTINALYPNLNDYYSVLSERLYVHGDWYGEVLKPNSPDIDVARLVFKKESGQWKLAVNKPELVISQIIYPDIPIEVLSDINNIR